MKRKREAIEKQIMEEERSNDGGNKDEEDEVVEDWKDMVRKNKKQKKDNSIQGSFDDL